MEFRISGLAGGEARPLAKVASGGELSRISLAIQVVASRSASVPTLVFDEVDVGIGGGVAEVVGRLLASLGRDRQVLCVTHLPQVAARAAWQWQVSKGRDGDAVTSRVVTLDAAGRVEEIARMLGGVEITAITRRTPRKCWPPAETATKLILALLRLLAVFAYCLRPQGISFGASALGTATLQFVAVSLRRFVFQAIPASVSTPVAANTAAAAQRICFSGSRCASFSPISTAGTLAASMPSVVPATTQTSASYLAASAMVANCVLSPISAMKKAIVVVTKAPAEVFFGASSSSNSSGFSVHRPKAMKTMPVTQRIVSGEENSAISVPTQPASAWLASVATRMPAMIAHGRRRRGQHEGKQLCLVADFGERDEAGSRR